MRCLFKGSGTALITPFNESGVNFDALAKLLEYQIQNGTSAIVAIGTTGEPSTMTNEEKRAVIDFTVQTVAGRIPVIAGTGCNNTAQCIESSKYAKSAGADATLVVTPYYNKATQAGLIAHYNAIADAVDIPIIVYNVPPRTGLNMLPETLAKIAEHENIWGMKEASANIDQITEMGRLVGDKIALYSGNDDHVVPLMSVGGMGVISVASNVVPSIVAEMTQKWLEGDVVAARQLQFKLSPLIKQLFSEVNPIPVKAAMNLIGFDAGNVRMPLTPLTDANTEALKKALTDIGLDVKEQI